jgi:hypothetical protein
MYNKEYKKIYVSVKDVRGKGITINKNNKNNKIIKKIKK